MKKFFQDSGARVISAITSLIYTILLARSTSSYTLSVYFLCYSISGILVWITDFGTVTGMIRAIGMDRINVAKVLFSIKLIVAALIAIFLTILTMTNIIEMFSYFLLISTLLDNMTDSLIGFRQVFLTPVENYVFNIGKKLLSLTIILIFISQFDQLQEFSIFISLIIPSFWIMFMDIRRIGFSFQNLNKKIVFSNLGIWLQGGGTKIASLDNAILSIFGLVELINILNISRKILSIFTIPTAVLANTTVYISATENFNLIRNHYNLVKIILFFSIPFSFFVGLVTPFVLRNIFHINASDSLLITGSVVLFIAPLGLISSNLNSFLLGRGSIRGISISTYTSSVIYISLILIGSLLNHETIFLIVALLANIIIEISILLKIAYELGLPNRIHEN